MPKAQLSIIASTTLLCVLSQSCKPAASEPQAPPAAPVQPAFPEPPELHRDASLCVLRSYDPDQKTWGIAAYPYDASTRVLGDAWPLQFDAEGRVTTRGRKGSAGFDVVSYDAHGNMSEWATWGDLQLNDGTRWDNHYEGDPPRLVSQDISDFRAPKERNAPHTHVSYRYDAAGHVDEQLTQDSQGGAKRRFTWRGERIIAIHEAIEPRPANSELAYEEAGFFEYDAQSRLIAYARDGEMPYSEGGSADGKVDQRETFYYDSAGHLERIERDGQIGDVAPEAPDGKPDAVTLFTPPCDPLIKLAPRLFGMPELFLPETITPPLR